MRTQGQRKAMKCTLPPSNWNCCKAFILPCRAQSKQEAEALLQAARERDEQQKEEVSSSMHVWYERHACLSDVCQSCCVHVQEDKARVLQHQVWVKARQDFEALEDARRMHQRHERDAEAALAGESCTV